LKYSPILRNSSILKKKSKLDHLHTFNNCPASMACTIQDQNEDLVMDQIWDICQKTGLIQLRKIFPLEVVYQFSHNDGIGKVWENHDIAFLKFILNFNNLDSIFEIGAGAGRVGKLFLSENKNGNWVGLEPNHHYEKIIMKNFTHKREWFDDGYIIDGDYDAIVHSHVIEHMYNPISFLETIHQQMDDNSYHLFSVPNLFYFIQKKYTNALNFEHTLFITEDIIDNLLKQIGFSIIKKDYHSELPCIFYACQKAKPDNVVWDRSIYKKNKQVFLDFLEFHRNDVDRLNEKINDFDGDIFLFGAHIFSQFLIFNGLETNKIINILDNSKMKQKNRLYGTSLKVESPTILKNFINPVVILKAGMYNDEIKDDILSNINSNVIIWE